MIENGERDTEVGKEAEVSDEELEGYDDKDELELEAEDEYNEGLDGTTEEANNEDKEIQANTEQTTEEMMLENNDIWPLIIRKGVGVNPLIGRYDIDDKWLREFYREKNVSATKIAKRLGISPPTVLKIIAEHGMTKYNPDPLVRLENDLFDLTIKHPNWFKKDFAKYLGVDPASIIHAYKRMRNNGKMEKLNAELEKLKKK